MAAYIIADNGYLKINRTYAVQLIFSLYIMRYQLSTKIESVMI